MSSHQLEFIKLSPHIGIILNLYEDHLDHDGSIEKYHMNKMNIFKYQNENDYSIYSDDNKYLNEYMKNDIYKGIKYTVRFDNEDIGNNTCRLVDKDVLIDNEIVYHDDDRIILGDSNLKNITLKLPISLKGESIELKYSQFCGF